MTANRLAVLVLLTVCALFVGAAFAGSVTFADVCDNPRFVQTTTSLQIFCPKQAQPWMTFKGCVNAVVRRDSRGYYKVTCGLVGAAKP